MTLSRRSVVSGAVALAAASAVPAPLVAGGLTPEERAFLARHPVRLSAAGRARALAIYRECDPDTRRLLWLVCDLSQPKLRQLIVLIDAMRAGVPEHELAILQRRFLTPEPEGMA